MATHKHWNAPAEAEAPKTVEPKPTPAITHVWLAISETDGDKEQRIYLTEAGCKQWRRDIVRENWNLDEEMPEDPDEAAELYFEYNESNYESFSFWEERIRS